MTDHDLARQQQADKMEFAAGILRALIVSPQSFGEQPQALVHYAVSVTDELYGVFERRIADINEAASADDDHNQGELFPQRTNH